MSDLGSLLQTIAKYRICLERDSERGIIPASTRASIDAAFLALSAHLRHAQCEIEGAGLWGRSASLQEHFVSGCARIAREMFVGMYRHDNPARVRRCAQALHAEAQTLMEHLRSRIESAA